MKIEHHPYKHAIPIRNKYSFADMSVGDRMIIPVEKHERPALTRNRVDTAVRMWRRRQNMDWWRFYIEYDDENVYIYRLEDIFTEGHGK